MMCNVHIRMKNCIRKKIFIFVALILSILLIGIGVFVWKGRDERNFIESKNIERILVKMEGAFPSDYMDEPIIEFEVEEKENINHIVTTLEMASDSDKNRFINYIEAATKYNIIIYNVDGSFDEYQMQGYNTINNNSFSAVINSEEVLRQVRKVFHIDLDEVTSLEFYHWEKEDSDMAVTEKLPLDREMILKLVELMQKEVLVNPQKTNISTKSGLLLKGSGEALVLGINLSKDMSVYNEIIDILPQYKQFIQN